MNSWELKRNKTRIRRRVKPRKTIAWLKNMLQLYIIIFRHSFCHYMSIGCVLNFKPLIPK
jgi:hypothetical protein